MNCTSPVWHELVAQHQTDTYQGPLGWNYMFVYTCGVLDHVSAFIVLALFTMYVLFVLATTADLYFSPTLSAMCETLKMSHQVAGVTLLAAGNAAPDTFSMLAAFTHGEGAHDMGLGALFGGLLFVSTIVFGGVVLASSETVELSPTAYKRDMLFLLGTLLLLLIVGVTVGYFTLVMVGLYLCVYVVYVGVVVYQRPKLSGRTSSMNEDPSGGGVMSAFWIGQDDAASSNQATQGGAAEDPSNYEFVTLPKNNLLNHKPALSIEMPSRGANDHRDGDGEQERAVDATGHVEDDAHSTTSQLSIQDSYFGVPDYSDTTSPTVSDAKSEGWFSPFTNTFSKDPGYQRLAGSGFGQSLLSNTATTDSGEFVNLDRIEDADSPASSRPKAAKDLLKRPPNFWKGVYWQNNLYQKSARRRLFPADWRRLSLLRLFFVVIEWPFVVLRTLTIPNVEEESWSKPFAVFYPLSCTTFYIVVTQLATGSNFSAFVKTVWVLSALSLTVAVYLFTYNSKPPTNRAVRLCYLGVAFASCVGWIFLFASELIAVLATLGHIVGIDISLLGLTVLAWGNGAGELVADIALSRAGYPKMALAGCFGAPIFSMIVGFGLSMLVVTATRYPEPMEVEFDRFALLATMFVLVALVSGVVFVVKNNYRVTKQHAFFLLGLYAVFVLACGIMFAASV